MVAAKGVEPLSTRVWAVRSNQLSYAATSYYTYGSLSEAPLECILQRAQEDAAKIYKINFVPKLR